MVLTSPRSEEVEKRHLLHSGFNYLDSSSSSSTLIYDTSSSTLYPHLEDDFEEEKLFSFDANFDPNNSSTHERDQPIFTTILPTRPHSWRRTPLTAPALTRLVLQLLLSFGRLLLPSFFFARSSPRHLHPTSHLDGLRGVAAFIVLIDHFVLNWYYTLRNGYLNSPADTHYLQLPILRLIFAGRASVAIFFAISGFVLSYKPLKLIRSSNRASAFDTFSSSVFRRAIRLYIPIIAGTLISAYLAYNGYYTPVPARTELIPPQMWTPYYQLEHWFYATLGLLIAGLTADPNRVFAPAYNGHLWTIPIEFYGSMAVFLSVLGTARARPVIRMFILTTLATSALWVGRWDLSLFIGGAVLAEANLACSPTHEETLPNQDLPLPLLPGDSYTVKPTNPWGTARTPFTIFLLLLSLFLLSYAGESPSPGLYHAALTPYVPYIYTTMHLGPEHFFLAIGALLLLSLSTLPFSPALLPYLKRPFTTGVAQYLGDVSYALYIVHGMVLFTIGTGLQEKWTGQVGVEKWVDGGFGSLVLVVIRLERDDGVYWRSFWIAGGACFVGVFWAADLFWRGVDRNVVKGGRWIEGVCGGRR